MLSPPNNSNLWPSKNQAGTQFIHWATERLTDLEQGHNTSRFMFDKHAVYRYICRISNALSILIKIISTQLLFYYKPILYTDTFVGSAMLWAYLLKYYPNQHSTLVKTRDWMYQPTTRGLFANRNLLAKPAITSVKRLWWYKENTAKK